LSNYYLDASKYTCPVAAKIISIRVYAGVACGIRAGVYTDNSGVPGSFLAETSSASGGTGWRTINLITPVNVAAGDYWLAVTSDTASGICDTTGGDMKYCSFPAYGPLPNPLFGSPLLDFPNIHITAYAIYTCQ